ncbi:hypothetical protein BH11MYX1_BH11MYX1_07460 [soil metagenome]
MVTRRLHKYVDRERVQLAVETAEHETAGEIVVVLAPWFWGSADKVANRTYERRGIGRTRGHCGVLIFVCPRRRTAIVLGDSAIHARAGQRLWDDAVEAIRAAAKLGDLTAGIVRAIELVGGELAVQFPRGDKPDNELPDAPIDAPIGT